MTSNTTAMRQRTESLGFGRAMLLVFMPFACGYFFSYFYRSVNAIVAPNLRADVGANAAELGLLTAAYLLAFAACQIPLGVLLDRYGPRRVQGILYCVAALGAFLFSLGDSVLTLLLARALIGAGVSGGLMAALKAIVLWFPKERYPLINGWYFSSGAIGALAATAPSEFALHYMDWRGLFVILAAATVVAAALILLVVPEKPGSAAGGSLGQQVREIGQIYRDRYFWRIVPLMFTCASAQMAIQGLWAGPWLTDVDGLARTAVADHLLVMAAGMAVGVTLSGPFATLMRRIGIDIAGACAVAAVAYVAIMLVVVTRISEASYVVWGLVGMIGTQTSLVFAMAFTYQFGLGAIIELWPPLAGGAYPADAYVSAFLTAVATQVVALVWFLLPLRGRG